MANVHGVPDQDADNPDKTQGASGTLNVTIVGLMIILVLVLVVVVLLLMG